MCGRFTLRTPQADVIRYFGATRPVEFQLPLRYNIAPTQQVPVIRAVGSAAERELTPLHWGLIPAWAKDDKQSATLINARSETAAEKPSFRTALAKRRCLVPADGFYEWKAEGRRKQPYYIRLADDRPFAFAGLWERWSGGEAGPVESFTILTTAANELLRPLHERMPVILSPADYLVWLDTENNPPDSVRYLFESYPASEMTLFPVTPAMNSPRYDGPDCIEPAETQGSLF